MEIVTYPPHNLPAALTSLIGREQEVEAICQNLLRPGVRLLTLTGPGGSGKTRLAQEVAQTLLQKQASHFPDGLYFINLTTINDPNLLMPAIAESLGLKEGDGQTLNQILLQFIRARRMLLILDNFEQLLGAGQTLLQLLNHAAGLQLLLTSRTLLQLYGEYEYPVPPLALPDLSQLPPTTALGHLTAIALFVERAQAVKPSFMLTSENGATIAEICVRLDGLPLAIELAAARSKLFNPTAILAQLTKLDFLVNPNRHATGRQRTLRGAIDWSFNLLDPEARQLFVQLGIFVGPFSLSEAVALLGDDPNLPYWLETLLNQNMIQRLETAGDEPYFRLLLILREYANEQLTQSGKMGAMQARHAHYYLHIAEEAAANLLGPEQANWLNRLETAYDNLRAALTWSQQAAPELWVRLTLALVEFWKIRGHFSEGSHWLTTTLGQTADGPLPIYALNLLGLGALIFVWGNLDEGRRYLEMALTLWRELNDPAGIAQTQIQLGRIAWVEEQYEVARSCLQEALAIVQAAGDETQVAIVLNNLGLISMYELDDEVAFRFFEQSLAISRRVGNLANIAANLNNLGAITQAKREDHLVARRYFEDGLAIMKQLGYRRVMMRPMNNLGNNGLNTGDLEMAERYFKESLALSRQLGLRQEESIPLHGLGVVASRRNDFALALAYYQEGLAVWREAGRKRDIPSLVRAITSALANLNQPEAATQLMGALERLNEEIVNQPPPEPVQKAWLTTIGQTKGLLGANRFVALWETGRNMTLTETVDFASQFKADSFKTVQAPAGTPPLMPLTGQRYLTDRLLAVGGMGEVYLGRDSLTNDLVVIKRLKPELVQQNREMVARFAREGALLRQLNHPNIVKMLATVQGAGGEHLLVLEYVSGGSLRELLTRQPQLPIQRVLEIGLELADALTRAHHLHIVHRDLKPENVLLAEDGTPRLTDFGISYQLQPETRLTQPGVVMGTAAYVGPEGFLGEEIDARSDIWSFGVILYEMLAGRHPFQGENLLATLNAILQQSPPPLSRLRPETPPALMALIAQMLDKNRANRPATMRQVAARLDEIEITHGH